MKTSFALALCVSLALIGSETIEPGDPALDTSHIRSRVDTLMMFVHRDGQTALVGGMYLETTVDHESGIAMRRERYSALGGAQERVDSFAVDIQTLAPVRRHDGGDGFTRGTAFYGNSMDFLLGALPLELDYTAELRIEPLQGVSDTLAAVRVLDAVELEMLRGPACAAWVVEVKTGDQQGTYWISKDARALLQYEAPAEGLSLKRIKVCPAAVPTSDA